MNRVDAIGVFMFGATLFAGGLSGGWWFLFERDVEGGHVAFYGPLLGLVMLVAGPLLGSYIAWLGTRLYRENA